MTFEVLLDSCTNKFSKFVCMVIGLLSLNEDFKAVGIEVLILSFSATFQAYCENMYMTFKSYLAFSLFLERELKSARSIPRYHRHLLHYMVYEGIFFTQVCIKCTWFDLKITHPQPFSQFYWPLLFYRPKTCYIFRIIINFTQRH